MSPVGYMSIASEMFYEEPLDLLYVPPHNGFNHAVYLLDSLLSIILMLCQLYIHLIANSLLDSCY